jgi:hypothetical protein
MRRGNHRPNLDVRAALVLAIAALLLPAGGALAKKEGARYGLEGRIVKYDESRDVMIVKVVKTKVGGGAGTGRVAGKPAPKSIKRGTDLEFAVVPEGSVLQRTVIKNMQGGGLDTTGTREGFNKALSMVPKDKNVVFSFEKAKKPGGPEWDLRIIQLRMTEEEWEARQKEREEAELKREQERKARLGETDSLTAEEGGGE